MFLGEIIKKYRHEHKLSQRDFARRSDISYTYVSALEKNLDYRTKKPISPTLDVVKKIANAIDIPLEDMLKMLDSEQTITLNTNIINVYSSVHAGILSEMIENVVDTDGVKSY